MSSVNHQRIPYHEHDSHVKFGTDKSLTSISRYDSPLPYSWLGQLFIPDAVFRQFVDRLDQDLPPWASRFVVLEKSELIERDEYCHEEGSLGIVAQRYVSSDLLISIEFCEGHPPSKIKAYLLKSMTVEDVKVNSPLPGSNNLTYSAKFQSLESETARIVWKPPTISD